MVSSRLIPPELVLLVAHDIYGEYMAKLTGGLDAYDPQATRTLRDSLYAMRLVSKAWKALLGPMMLSGAVELDVTSEEKVQGFMEAMEYCRMQPSALRLHLTKPSLPPRVLSILPALPLTHLIITLPRSSSSAVSFHTLLTDPPSTFGCALPPSLQHLTIIITHWPDVTVLARLASGCANLRVAEVRVRGRVHHSFMQGLCEALPGGVERLVVHHEGLRSRLMAAHEEFMISTRALSQLPNITYVDVPCPAPHKSPQDTHTDNVARALTCAMADSLPRLERCRWCARDGGQGKRKIWRVRRGLEGKETGTEVESEIEE